MPVIIKLLVVDITIRLAKLCVIESIEKFGAELQIDSFLNERVFQKCHIPIVQAWPREESAARGSQRAQVFGRKQLNIEIWLTGTRIGYFQRTGSEVRSVDWK